MPRWTARSRKGGRTETGTETVTYTGRPAGAYWGLERKKGGQAQTGRVAGAGVKKESVGRGCVGALGGLRGG